MFRAIDGNLMARILLMTALLLVSGSSAEARVHHRHHRHSHYRHGHGRVPWCGIYMMQWTGIHKAGLALARNWMHEGSPADGPCVGCIVVWPHHVGAIVGQQNGRWLVHSGNDGNAVRTRPWSLRGAIAFRHL